MENCVIYTHTSWPTLGGGSAQASGFILLLLQDCSGLSLLPPLLPNTMKCDFSFCVGLSRPDNLTNKLKGSLTISVLLIYLAALADPAILAPRAMG